MNTLLRILPLFFGFGAAYLLATNVTHLSKTEQAIMISLGILALGYLFTWFNIRMMYHSGDLSQHKALSPVRFGHVLMVAGAASVGLGFSANRQLLFLVALVCLWFADELLTRTRDIKPGIARPLGAHNRPLLHYLCRMLLDGPVKSMGLKPARPYALEPGKAYSAGELMARTDYMPIFHQREYVPPGMRISSSHAVVGKDGYRLIQYSSDMRETPAVVHEYGNFLGLALKYAETQKTKAISRLIAQDNRSREVKDPKSLEGMRSWVELRSKYETVVAGTLADYARSQQARALQKIVALLVALDRG